LSVSTVLSGQYGLPEVALALPCVVNAKGRDRILTPSLTKGEEDALRQSAAELNGIIAAHVKSH
jgi:L-lactate dehydrogenase